LARAQRHPNWRLPCARYQWHCAVTLADYYDATTFNAPSTYPVIPSNEKFYEISFNRQIAFPARKRRGGGPRASNLAFGA
jgi:hypothetical protein